MLCLARLPFNNYREGELHWFSICDRVLTFCDFWVSTNLFKAREVLTLLLSNNISLSIEAAFKKERRNPLSLALFAPAVIPNPFITYKPNITKLLGVLALFTLSGYGIILAVIACILFSRWETSALYSSRLALYFSLFIYTY